MKKFSDSHRYYIETLGRIRLPKISLFKKKLSYLVHPNKWLIKDLGHIAKQYAAHNKCVDIYSAIMDVFYRGTPLYYEGILYLIDYIFYRINPRNDYYSKFKGYIHWFTPKLIDIMIIFFKYGDIRTKVRADGYLIRWKEDGLFKDHFVWRIQDQIKKFYE